MFDSAGQQFTAMANVRDLELGNLHASNVRMLEFPSQITPDPQIAGLLGANFLRHYDLELDLAAHKLNLFSQNHCPGQVIYWKADAVAVVPIRVVQSGHIIVPLKLDDREMDALFDTGSSNTLLTRNAATGLFHLTPGSADTPDAGHSFYKHVFGKLQLEGVAIGYPTVLIHDDLFQYGEQQSGRTGTRIVARSESNGDTDMILGMAELRHLHMFLSYKEEKLYLTAAAAAPGSPPAMSTASEQK